MIKNREEKKLPSKNITLIFLGEKKTLQTKRPKLESCGSRASADSSSM